MLKEIFSAFGLLIVIAAITILGMLVIDGMQFLASILTILTTPTH